MNMFTEPDKKLRKSTPTSDEGHRSATENQLPDED